MIGQMARRLKNKAFGTTRNLSRQVDTWTLVPATARDIDLVRKKCRRIVMRRAAVSAGVAAVPIPGIDIATDISLLMRLMEEINAEFGLTPEQIEHLQPKAKIVVYQSIVSMGGVVVGKLITREVVTQLIRRTGVKMLAKHTARIVPVAGQVASAALGFAAFRTIGYEHIEACARVAQELMMAEAKGVHD